MLTMTGIGICIRDEGEHRERAEWVSVNQGPGPGHVWACGWGISGPSSWE